MRLGGVISCLRVTQWALWSLALLAGCSAFAPASALAAEYKASTELFTAPTTPIPNETCELVSLGTEPTEATAKQVFLLRRKPVRTV